MSKNIGEVTDVAAGKNSPTDQDYEEIFGKAFK